MTEEHNKIQKMMLWALNMSKKGMYMGTVTHKEKVKRRAKAKLQKRSRRINRKAK